MGSDEDTRHLLNQSHKKQGKKKLRWVPTCWYIDCLPFIKARYVLVFMLFLGLSNVYALRVNLSVAIVQMTAKNPEHGQRYGEWLQLLNIYTQILILEILIGQI